MKRLPAPGGVALLIELVRNYPQIRLCSSQQRCQLRGLLVCRLLIIAD
jgi:hypothetical protein